MYLLSSRLNFRRSCATINLSLANGDKRAHAGPPGRDVLMIMPTCFRAALSTRIVATNNVQGWPTRPAQQTGLGLIACASECEVLSGSMM
jgi:hypothetical protein